MPRGLSLYLGNVTWELFIKKLRKGKALSYFFHPKTVLIQYNKFSHFLVLDSETGPKKSFISIMDSDLDNPPTHTQLANQKKMNLSGN